MVLLLLRHGADVNARGCGGKTALGMVKVAVPDDSEHNAMRARVANVLEEHGGTM